MHTHDPDLVVTEAAGEEDDDGQDGAEVEVVETLADAVRDEAKDGPALRSGQTGCE